MNTIIVLFMLLSFSLIIAVYSLINKEEKVIIQKIFLSLGEENAFPDCPIVINEDSIFFYYKGGKIMNLSRPLREGAIYTGDNCTLYNENGILKIKTEGTDIRIYELHIKK
ncbi:MAG: hypothetical protein GY828_05750 [Candidatus Gracilibacteria bacterium]|nr:hypothetical protein [Candidatus Gracilibacteria bacterium]